MKLTMSKTLLALSFLCPVALVACGGSVTDPETGEEHEWEFPDDPTQAEIDEAYAKLEEAKQRAEDVLEIAQETNNSQMEESAQKAIDEAVEYKEKLSEMEASDKKKSKRAVQIGH